MVHSEQSVEQSPHPVLGVDGCTDAVEVGRGGFGVVYRAWQPAFSRWVAVKVLAADWHGPSRTRFERELRMLGRLSDHPHIVTLHQAGRTAAGNPYLLMAYEEGGSLSHRLRGGTAGDWREAVAGGITVAGALETAHRSGVLHRDVKPENILISGYGEPKLADFGQARPRSADRTDPRGRITASVLHAAPEVLRGAPASVAADVYALASTVLHWIHGAPAFTPATGESLDSLLRRIAVDPVPDLRAQGVPDGVCAALERAMAKDPALRPATAAEFADELRAAQSAAGVPVTPFVLGGSDTAGPAAGEPGGGAASLSLTDRRRAALALSATAAHQPSGVRPRTLLRSFGLLTALAAVLATGYSQAVPTPAPVELPITVALGELELYAESDEQVVSVRNRDDRPVRVTGVTLTGPSRADLEIVGDGCSPGPVGPGDRCEVRVVAVPRTAGPIRASLELTAAGRSASTTLTGAAQPRRASRDDAPPGPCYADAYQVGASAYGYAGGLKAISVKQYWSPSCRATMAYVWVWKQYRDNVATDGGTWTVGLAIRTERPVSRQRAVGQPYELWTEPHRSAGTCTTASATVTADRTKAATSATTEPYCDR
ncbi:serine/threonine-protein kinase [Micromonospora halophytica]|uniref:non-specific serine/threonine protein kinase n=1 Tax=Micromonospora halophytica TaxID=47864 RepID=A0A1C5JCP9_9ACTN|nr:serine/threonine-protein kinase [Micromonospora halophytica]SCG68322.1 Serine/threonine protein kinase [Micromonospora halophytica]